MIEWYISQGDVEKHPDFGEKSLDDILYSLGMDVRLGYQTDGRETLTESKDTSYGFCHRSTLTGEVSCGLRYVGAARQDGKWKRFIDRFLNLPIR